MTASKSTQFVLALTVLLLTVETSRAATLTPGFYSVGRLPGGGSFASRVYGVSADGLTVAGENANGGNGEAFRWTLAGGITALGLPSWASYTAGYGVSADGSVIVGTADPKSTSEQAIGF